ncbi:hypothetical protein GC197_01490 [bacterium]|nr:hypothetical protein [bacterium]
MSGFKSLFQWSLGELVTIFSILAVLMGSIWAPMFVSRVVMVVAWLAVMLVFAMIWCTTGDWRRFAIGFSVMAIGYFLAVNAYEVNRDRFHLPARCPTVEALDSIYALIVHEEYFMDGKPFPGKLRPNEDGTGAIMNENGIIVGVVSVPNGGWKNTTGKPYLYRLVIPDEKNFYTAGHIFWVFLFGYLGAKVTVAIGRIQENQKARSTQVQDRSRLIESNDAE